MNNIINYFYNLFPTQIKKMYGGFYFEAKEVKYLLVELFMSFDKINEIYEKLVINKVNKYLICYNKDGKPVSRYEEKDYILFRINCDDKETLRFDEQIYIPVESSVSWSNLWSERINYYEIQINELALNKHVIWQSVYYYIGLAENAIAIAGKYESKVKSECMIQHYRMNVPVKKGEYYNPNNMIIDVFIRDISEYIKSSFFYEEREIDYYIEYINNIKLTEITANLLLSRILYPTYYFDIFDEIILNDREEDDLIPTIRRHKEFETFIIRLYNELQKKYSIINIDWIKKRTINQR